MMAYPSNQQPSSATTAAAAAAGANMPRPQHYHHSTAANNYYDEHGRPRANTGFSLHSHKSSGSAKIEETHDEKEQQRLHTKADPSVAMNEAEPAAVAALQATSIGALRAIQHKDGLGNIIADPDKSNPTRNRWERPLDTIRAFEAAIDGNYTRKSMYRTETPDTMSNYGGYSRRASYYGNQGPMNDRPGYGGNYGRSQSYRPDSQMMNRPDSYYGNGYGGHGGGGYDVGPGPGSNGYAPNRGRVPRTASEPFVQYNMANSGGYGMPSPGYPHHQPYDNMSHSGSASTPEPAGYQTDPSSENSSIDRIAPSHYLNAQQQQQQQQDGYGSPQMSGYGSPSAGGYGGMGGDSYQQQQNAAAQRMGDGYMTQSPPPPAHAGAMNPSHMNGSGSGLASGQRAPIKLSGPTSPPVSNPHQARPDVGEKRKSWFGKRFSRS